MGVGGGGRCCWFSYGVSSPPPLFSLAISCVVGSCLSRADRSSFLIVFGHQRFRMFCMQQLVNTCSMLDSIELTSHV